MTTDRRARRARESARALTPSPTSTVPQTVEALRRGARWMWGNPHADGRAWSTSLDYSGLPPDVSKAVGDLADNASRTAVVAAAEACERAAADDGLSYAVRERCAEVGERARFLAAFLGDYISTCIAMHQADIALAASVDDAERRMLLTTRAELSYVGHLQLQGTYDPQRDATRIKIRESAWDDLRAEAELVRFWEGLDAQAAGPVRDDTGMDPRDEDHPGWFEEEFGPADAAEPAGVEVFPKAIVDAVGKAENRSAVERALGKALGARLPLVPVPADWDAWEAGHVARSPWLAAVPRALRAEQGGRPHWGHAVLAVVGPPGCGKTRLVRELASASRLAYARLNAEAASDTAAFGTSVRWASAQAGLVERTLVSAGAATALLHYDELEKAAGSRQSNSGRLTDLLHGLWEPETASAWTSVWLGHPIDAGHLVHVVTVNSLDGLPSSLLDRMRVVRVGEPGPEHLGLLAPALAREACREFGLDERWGDLDREELDALAGAWRGGSVRRLQRLVRAILQARDLAPVARH